MTSDSLQREIHKSRSRLLVLVGSLCLVGLLPGMVAAQEDAADPQAADWVLTGYLPDGSAEPLTVPFGIQATLRLEDGTATGSGGCNTFSGGYTIDGASLDMADQLALTLAICDEASQSIEDAYLGALPQVAGWSIANGQLQLADELGGVLLTFEMPTIGLTGSQLAALEATLQDLRAQVDRANERIDNASIPTLRDRIKTLESDSKALRDQLASAQRAARATPRPTEPRISLSRAEQVLLRGIPERIASRCTSWRQVVPPGTVAALRCTPDTTAVSAAFYYLMEADDARSAFDSEMSTRAVPAGDARRCADGDRAWRGFEGTGPGFWIGEGCDRDPGPQVFVGFVDAATRCRQLDVGGTRLRDPAYYITLQGSHNAIERTYDWAKRGANANDSFLGIATQIPSSLRLAPSCDS
jgi:heat shock protein HslJ